MRKFLPLMLLLLVVSTAWLSRTNEVKKNVVKRQSMLRVIQRDFSPSVMAGWKDDSDKSWPVDAHKTHVTLADTGNSLAEKYTVISIVNPEYTQKLATEDFDTFFAGSKWLGNIESAGFQKIVFSNGKQTWVFPARLH